MLTFESSTLPGVVLRPATQAGLARAIAIQPAYMLYDEPTTGLDPVTSAVIDELMVRTREALGVTSIVITHDMRSAYTVGDRIAMLYRGRIRQVGTVEAIRHSEDPVVRGRKALAGLAVVDPARTFVRAPRCNGAPAKKP